MGQLYLYRIMIHQKKIGGSSKNTFLLATSIYSASKPEFANNSLKSQKIRKLNIDTLIIPQGLLNHEKKPDQKQKISCYCSFKGLGFGRPWRSHIIMQMCSNYSFPFFIELLDCKTSNS